MARLRGRMTVWPGFSFHWPAEGTEITGDADWRHLDRYVSASIGPQRVLKSPQDIDNHVRVGEVSASIGPQRVLKWKN